MALSTFATKLDLDDIVARAVSLVDAIGYKRLAGTVVSAYASWKLLYALFLSPLRNIPGPFIARLTGLRAMISLFAGNSCTDADSDFKKYGEIYVYGPNTVSISNPAASRTILGSHAAATSLDEQTTFSSRNPHINQLRRRQMGPMFTFGYLHRMEPTIIKYGAAALKTKWERAVDEAAQKGEQAVVNAHRDLAYATFDVTGALAFGRDFNALRNNDPTVVRWVNDSFGYFGICMAVPLLKYSPFRLLVWPLWSSLQELLTFARESIEHRRNEIQEGKQTPSDLLAAFLDSEDPESKIRMTSNQILAETIVTLLAGSETSSNTLLWTIHLLLLNPVSMKRVVDEVRTKFAKDHVVTYSEGRTSLPYLEACLYESMRLRPVSGGQWPRLVPKGGITVCGHFLPEGTVVNLNFSGIHHHADCWHEPYMFTPERFLDNDEAKRKLLTFSTGVRICPGRNLAWMEMVPILANLLKDFDISLPEDVPFGPEILDESGYPKVMDSKHYIVPSPTNSDRDGRIVISRA
ncbi:cytochrome P450 [Linderina pennispora]|uniref:Cytochrome P450 n=1 Tax=Linderina pennispora TaxID=61395 RepID=A0A1Y1WE19_9FUNG|nr:cytochrome P450 [Linderina pennispora]ORX71771.1 cytochrome P450 [Linderina pennispora]